MCYTKGKLCPIHKAPGSPNYTHSLTNFRHYLTDMNPPGDTSAYKYPQEITFLDLLSCTIANVLHPLLEETANTISG